MMNIKLALPTALLIAAAAFAPAALANNATGELCSVQSADESIVIGSFTVGTTTSEHASRQQLADAGAFCTSMIQSYGWYPSNKNYDEYVGQLPVCQVIGATNELIVHADPANWSNATDDCYGLQAANPGTRIVWEQN